MERFFPLTVVSCLYLLFFEGREEFSSSDGVRWRRSFHHQGILNVMVRESYSAPLCAGTTTPSHRLQISGGNIDLQKWVEVGRCRSSESLELDAGSSWQLVEWDKERHNVISWVHWKPDALPHSESFAEVWLWLKEHHSSPVKWALARSCAACLNRKGSNLKRFHL